MKNTPTVFRNEIFGQIRVIMKNNEPMFVAKDVAGALGYVKPPNAVARHCKKAQSIGVTETGTLDPQTQLIPESDVYRLIMRSNLSSVERFQDWVTEEILPSVRQHGFYGTDQFLEEALADPNNWITVLEKYKEERDQRRLAEQQRDHAIKTKAWIGCKREAMAMNTASRLSKENKRLREQIEDSEDWKPLKAIRWLKDFFILHKTSYGQIGNMLANESMELGYGFSEILHSKYGVVIIYHKNVIQHFKRRLLEDRNLMRKYRKNKI